MHSWDFRFEIYLQFYIFYNIYFIFTATEEIQANIGAIQVSAGTWIQVKLTIKNK